MRLECFQVIHTESGFLMLNDNRFSLPMNSDVRVNLAFNTQIDHNAYYVIVCSIFLKHGVPFILSLTRRYHQEFKTTQWLFQNFVNTLGWSCCMYGVNNSHFLSSLCCSYLTSIIVQTLLGHPSKCNGRCYLMIQYLCYWSLEIFHVGHTTLFHLNF